MGIDFILERGWKIILLGLVVVGMGVLITGFITVIGSAVTTALTGMNANFVAAATPSNLVPVLTTILTVKTAGTVYIAAMRFLQTKVSVLS